MLVTHFYTVDIDAIHTSVVAVRTWELALLWSSRVRQEKFSLGIDGADLEAIRQLVFAGFPTTKT